MKSKILITGGSGFIGTNLVQFFIDNDYEVANFDVNEPHNPVQKFVWKNIDINNFESFSAEVMNFCPDYIIHLAARTDLDGKFLSDYAANVKGVENLMSIIKELPHLKKIIITSSMLVCKTGYFPKNQFDYIPNTVYGESKAATEKMVWENIPSCDWCIIRPTSIWGPWFGVPYRNFFDMVISKRYFHIGNKSCSKTYGYIGNSVYQIEQILFSDTTDKNKKVFYIGDAPATNIEEWANEIAKELNISILKMPYSLIKIAAVCGDILKYLHIKFPMTTFRLKNMTSDNVIDLSETYRLAPNLPFSRKEGIKETLNWLQQFI